MSAPKPSSFDKAGQRLDSPVLPIFAFGQRKYIVLTLFSSILLLVASWLLPLTSQAAICLLPDCNEKTMVFVNTGAGQCIGEGFESIMDLTCPAYTNTIVCDANNDYIKCDAKGWCDDNDYKVTECDVPQYVSNQCPNGEHVYKECVEDYARACSDLNSEYVLECEEGYAHDENAVCPYSDSYAKCCNLCEDYPYLLSDIGQGYKPGDSCEACGEVLKYKRILDPCTGYSSCPEGGKTGASVCWHGEDKWYSECCSPCEAYDYTIDTIPQGYLAGASCDSCTGMKYMLAEGRCAEGYEWKNGSCVTCVASCAVGNILYSDYSCNSCIVEGKTAIGIIALEQGSKKIALSLSSNGMYWSADTVDVDSLSNYASGTEASSDYNGKENTYYIAKHYGTSASANAGVYCYNYVTAGTSAKQWYLPAVGELYGAIYANKSLVNDNLTSLGKDALSGSNYWSSSESSYAENAWCVSGSNGTIALGHKPSAGNVACALAFKDNGNGTAEICNAEYVYSCTPDEEKNILGGSGANCAGMYASCLCVTGSVWENGKCVCDDTCSVGNILYSDYSCSACLYDDRTPIGVIVKNDGTAGLALSVERKSMFWSADTVDVTYLANYNTVDGAKTDSLGKENTKIIVDFYGDTAVETSNAALYCYNYTTAGTSAHQWYLASVKELYFNVYMNYNTLSTAFVNKLGWTGFSWNFWSSTEMKASDAWSVQSETGGVYYGNGKQEDRSVSCMLSFNLDGEGEVDICSGDYLYACDGEHMSGGADAGCGGLYKSCECDSGYTAYKGLCCDMTCAVGNIMYSDMTCSSCLITEKTPIGVVVKSDGNNSLVMSNRTGDIQWGGYGTDISTLTNYSSDTVAKTDFSGKDNTAKIVAHFGENVDTSLHAGVFCHKYVTEGTDAGDWYLPAAGELYSYVYGNYNELSDTWTNKLAASCSYDFWSSSEEADSGAWVLTSSSGLEYSKLKYNISSVTCFLGVSIGDDGKAEVCENTYLYPCVGAGYASGVGESCGGLYASCTCEVGYDYADGKCTLCDAKYQYACVGENQTAGVGEGCGGLYESCECEDGYGFKDGVCGLCEDTFTYECVSNGSDNITGGAGESCSGKYEACSCSEGYEFTLGQCCDNTCKVGNILYSDMTCSSCVFDSKTPIGVVVKENELVISQIRSSGMRWSGTKTNVSGITETTDEEVAKQDFNGKANTLAIIATFTSDTVDNNAAINCNSYSTEGTNAGDWYLPAAGELYSYVYGEGTNYSKINTTMGKLGWTFGSRWYWSSSELSTNIAWTVGSHSDSVFGDSKSNYNSVSCFLGVSIGDDGSVEVCDPEYMHTCDGANASGVGEACGGLYKSCECANDTGWYINDCVDCDETKYKYSCTVGTGNITAGVGYSCGGLYESCECDSGYYWDSATGACVGCDAKYQYTCESNGSDNIVGTGEECGGFYSTCLCADGYGWENGACVACVDTCAVGHILYSDMTCSSCVLPSKTPIGVVVKSDGEDALVISQIRSTGMAWGTFGIDIPDLPNLSKTDAKADYNGKENTAILVVVQTTGGFTASNSPAINCYEYSTVGTNAGDWYLPAAGELYSYVYGGGTNYNKINTTMTTLDWTFGSISFWSSSEYNSDGAWRVLSNDGSMTSSTKYTFRAVSCFLPVSIDEDGNAEVCDNTYLYPCVGAGYASGVGESCGGLYASCTCEIGYDYADGKCTLCDAKYVYACVGENQTAGVGEGCGGLYESCECEDGYGFKDGVCGLCEDTFTYECVSNGSDNITGGAGESCSGKYEACTCSEGYEFTLGQCCDNTCKVGNILYSDMTCSSCVFDSKTPIGVVVKENELVISQIRSTSMRWSGSNTNVSGITETTDSAVAKQDFNGKANTLAIIATFTSDTVDNNAAINCNSYSTEGTNAGDWYLPAAGELYSYVYGGGTNYSKINTTMGKLGWTFGSRFFCSSSENSDDRAWGVHSSVGTVNYGNKGVTLSVSCFLGVSIGDDGSVEVCDPEYMHTCNGTNASGVGEACGGLYKSCECANDTGWYINDCVDCDETKYKYSCTVGTGNITAGVGYSCGGLYESCECDGGYYWDSTTGACVGCDAKYQYTCESTGSDNIVGTGEECGGYYSTCLCADGYGWENGACVACVDTCEVGHILYSDMTCSSCVLPNKTPIGVVVKDNELVMSNRTGSIQWGGWGTDIDTLTNYGSTADAKTDFNGKDNTAKLVAHFGEDVDTTLHAGVFCHKYTTEGTNAGDWYLPAAGELYSYVYGNYNSKLKATATKLGWDIAYYFWSSSEYGSNSAWNVSYYNGNMSNYGHKSYIYSVSCFLGVSIGDDGKAEVCENTYLYPCVGTGYASGVGEACGGLYTACSCAAGYEWIDGACVACGDTYKYACSADAATFTTGGAGESCGGLYESCECSTGYGWSADDESCAACDAKYQYACTPDETAHIVGGGDDTCGGSYSACECAEGYAWSGTQCCSTTCTVGAILYSDMTCSECLFADKTPIGVVVKDNELVMSNKTESIQWGGYGTDIGPLTNYSSLTDAKTDFSGKDNTTKIVTHFGENVDTTLHAGVFCYKYSTEGTNAGGWYLPAVGELYSYVYGGGTNYNKINTTMTTLGWTFGSISFWSSSEVSDGAAWNVYSSFNGASNNSSKSNKYSVICFLPFHVGEGGKAEICDNSYVNLCNGTGYVGGVGEDCNGYYESCTCAEGYAWNGTQCCSTTCTVGAILYSDMTCSSCVDNKKTVIGVVVKDNELVMSNKKSSTMTWSSSQTNVSGITEITDSAVAKQDFYGKLNTLAIVEKFTSGTVDNNAAINCNLYSTEGTNAGDWYLPAAGELYSYVYGNYNSIISATSWNLASDFWSSSEYSAYHAWEVGIDDGDMGSRLKTASRSVSCFLAIALGDDGNISACDSKYVYTCNGGNATGGVGEACGGYYESCTCAEGYAWSGTQCCSTTCTVGAILYSDMTCSACKIADKTPIGVVVKDNELVISQIRSTDMVWGTYGTDVDTLTNITSTANTKTDFNGKENTAILVSFQTTEGKTASNSPAINCNSYSTEGTNAGEWYLPAAGELYSYVYGNYSKINTTMGKLGWTFGSRYFWSSSENSDSYAWNVHSSYNDVDYYYKANGRSVSCFLNIALDDDGNISICDSKYVYSCSHTNATGGVGETCSGLYESCTCAEGYEWTNVGVLSQCCDMSCSVGNILYSDMTCSKCKIDGKTPIGVIVRNTDGNAAAMSIGQYQAYWATSSDYSDISEIANNTSSSNAKTDYAGMANTAAIVAKYGEDADETTHAGVYCYNYETEGTTAGQWYLPAAGEWRRDVWDNYSILSAKYSTLGSNYLSNRFWLSSEYNSYQAWYAYYTSSSNYDVSYGYKYDLQYYVNCFLPFQVGEDGTIETCESSYKYVCTSSSTTTGGRGETCGGHYESCECASGYYWSGTACTKCDAKYQYECVANADAGIVSGIGSSCGGLYSLCECAEGYGWENGECLACDSSCSIGNILFSDGTCSSCNLSSKTPIGVIGYESGTKKLAVALDNRKMTWAPQNRDVPTLTNITSSSTAKTDYNGKYNTKSILEYYGKNTAGVAARYCYNYVTSGTTAGQWYLPAMGELYDILYSNRTAINNRLKWMDITQLPSTSSDYYWSSTEYSSDYAWYFYSTSSLSYTSKLNNYIAQCVIPFEDKDDGTVKICGAEYQYECVYDEVAGVLGGVGDTCIGMYSSCECSDGREYINGKCCDNTCEVGNILYSDMTCSSCKLDGKLPIGVVAYANGTNRMAIDLENMKGKWSPDLAVIGTSATSAMSGKANTKMIVEYYGEDADDVAAVDCYNHKATDWDEHLWYLPDDDEWIAIRTSAIASKINAGFATLGKTIKVNSSSYWSSTEHSNSPSSLALYYGSSNGANSNKTSSLNFKCMLSFEETTTGKADVCSNSYAFVCTGTNETPKGVACGGKYKECSCTNGYGWSGTSCKDCSNPWGTTFKYTCDGTNQIGGIGETCGGLYEFCECAEGYSWRNGKCEDCSADCAVGDIVYSDLTCSGCVEEGKTPVGVIMYAEGDARIAMSLDTFRSKWNADGANVVGIPNTTGAYIYSSDYINDDEDYEGIIYTQAIVEQYGEDAKDNAGVFCYNYAPDGFGKFSWYLPSYAEITGRLCYQNNETIDKTYVTMNEVRYILGKEELFKTDKEEYNLFSALEPEYTNAVTAKNCKKPSTTYHPKKTTEGNFVCMIPLNYVDDNKVKVCSSEYKYTCSESVWLNYSIGGEGDSCGGRYKSCLCEKGYENYNGKCCRTTCGTYDFYYSDHTCSSCLIKEKTVIGVIVSGITIGSSNSADGAVWVRSLDIFKNKWSPDNVDIELGSSGAGKFETKRIVDYYGDNATEVAAVDCYNYTTEGTEKGQWYLPGTVITSDVDSKYDRLEKSLGMLGVEWDYNLHGYLWTSVSGSADTASVVRWLYNGASVYSYPKNEEYHFYCYLSLKYNFVDGKAYTCGEEYNHRCSKGTGIGENCGGYYKSCKCGDSYEFYLDSCIRCEDKYKYKCTYDINTHVVQGVGESCGGLYEACECEDGYTWYEGTCVFGTPVVPEEPDNPTSCGSEYQYECLGDGYIGGSGTSCNNLYTACECAEGYVWENGECVSMCEHGYVMVDGVCICDTSCAVGNILYSDMSCSGCVVENKTPIGIIAVAQDNARYALSLNTKSTAYWAEDRVDIVGLKNYPNSAEALKDFSGRLNTKKVVDYYATPSSSYIVDSCYAYMTKGTHIGQWYLPALGEINEARNDKVTLTAGLLEMEMFNQDLLSSTENGASYIWGKNKFGDNTTYSKTSNFTHRCMLPLEKVSDNKLEVCRSEYIYRCDALGQEGVGDSCGGMYKSCTCIEGSEEIDGKCCSAICEEGTILYSDGTCNTCVLADKTAIGVVAYANEGSGRLVTALEASSVKWSSNSVNIANLNNSDGKNNTQLIVDYYGTSVASTTAAVKCYNYTTTGTSVGQWYLPAKDELFNIWDNIYTINGVLTELGKTNLGVNSYHWTSTQKDSSSNQAYYVYRIADNYSNPGTSSSYNNKTTAYNTLCVMAVEDNGDGTINICSDDYKYSCQVANASGKGEACGGLYKDCECANGKGWYISSCVDCDETYKYACTGANEIAGIGETCGGFYTSCTCTEGMEWSEELGKCITDCETDYVWDDEQNKCVFDSCPVGSIYYSDGTCSLAVDSAKTAIGVVAVKDGNKRLVIALERMSNNWSDDDNDDVIDIQNYSTGTSAIADIAGKANTKILLEHYGDTNTYVAAINCYKYSTAGTDVGQWYLGAAGEMYPIWSKNWSLINNSFSLLGKTQLSATSIYWTSSENDYRFAHQMYGTGMNSNGFYKDYSYYIQCMLQVEDNGNNTAKVCGAEYLYPCEGNGYVGGVGEGCGQLYTACECAENYEYYKGRCCDTRCALGNILYSDGSCSSCRIAGKLPIGIVGYEDGDRRLVVTLESVFLEWSADKTDISSLYNYNTNAIADYSGLLNTQFVYDYYGENQSNNAAVYCYNYIPTDSGWDKGLWYLPAEGELKKIIYDNYAKINSGIVTIGKAVECPNWNTSIEKSYLKGKYWSSTEYGSDYAWFVDSNSGITEYNDKDYRYLVTCVLPINVNDDGLAIVCDDTYRYSCIGDYMVGGIGEACSGFYKDCQCEAGYGSYMGKCITCESKYQYNCSGEHIIGGLGYSCGGLYETCECELGYGFVDGTCTNCEAYKYECIPNTETHIKGGNGDKCGIGYSACECEYGYIWSEIEEACIQDTSCKVGYVYSYSSGKCFGSSKGNIVYANGSEFWVISNNSNNVTNDRWLSYDYVKEATDILFLENYATSIDAMLDDNGRINTKVVVDYYGGESNYSYSAANRCYNQKGRDYSIGRWYLPSVGEAVKIYENKDILGNVLPKYFLTSTEKDEGNVYSVSADGVDVIGKYSAVGNTNNNTHCIMMFNLNDDGTTTLCGSEYLYRCNDAHTSGVGETCAGHYKSCACDEGYGFYVKNCKICEDSFKYACSVGDNHISGGKDYPCGDLYEACECEIGYKWSETDGACVPCGAEYQYECTVDAATHIVGIGEDSCSIYYSSCACDVGYVWSETDGACVCDTSCKVGNILYSDGTCNGCVLEDKNIVGVVGYLGDDNTALLLRAGMISTKWSSNSVDIPGLKNWSSGYLKDMAGAENTQIIVDYYGEDATNNAAVTCHSYSTEGTEAGQWYLPSAGELAKIWETEENYLLLKKRMEKLGVNPSYSEYMFSSTEYNASYASQVFWSTNIDKVNTSTTSKTSSYYAYCVLPMVINDDGSLDACDAKYKFTCEGEYIVETVGESCGRWYEGCQCANGYVWENGYCTQTCDWEYQYECVFDELTSITGGVGEGCGGQYTACECAEGYVWSTGMEQCVSTCDVAYEWSEDESQCVCKSDYKYSCIGDKQVGGDSVTCNDLYSACECEVGYVWSNETGACECDSSCAVGQIYYSDGTCSSCVLEDRTAVGVVAYDIKGRKAVVALDSQTGYWSADNVNIPKLPDITNSTNALDDYRGKYNTNVIVEHYGNEVDTTKNAVVYCANYAPEGMEHTKGKWYLPALGELNVSVNTNGLLINNVFDALEKSYLGNNYWSSSEYGSSAYYTTSAGGNSTYSKTYSYVSRCFLHIGEMVEDKPEVCSMYNQYTCGSKTAGGIGEACGGLYTSCSCAEGMVFYNEECCNPKCIPGSIYYHDGTCSSCRIWEKTPIGMVVNDHLVVALKSFNTNWGLENIDIPELHNYATEEEAKTDFNGKVNTEILVKYYPGYAADKCNQYTTIGTEAGQWYLPAAGEIFEIYAYYNELKSLFSQFNVSRTNVQMSSTEASMRNVWEGNDSVASNITLGYQLQTATKNYSNTTGGSARSHLCVMAINLNDDEISSELCSSEYKYRCDGENASGVGDSCGGLYKSCTCSNGTEQFLKDCVVCEDSYKYSCEVVEDTYITGSNGWSCGGRYESCVCDDAHRWSDDEGACICDTSCSVGNILYSDGSCSSCALEDKTAVGIIAYNDSGRLLAVSLTSTSMKWSSTNDDIPNLPNVVSFANGDFNGKVNTKLIVDFYGKNATDNAAGYCYNYAPEAWSETKNSWYFPAAGEVYSIIKTNKEKISKALRTLGLNEFNSSYYNTSTEYSDSKPWIVDSNGILSYYYNYKSSSYDVLCVLPIEEQDDGTVAFCGDNYVATCDVSGTSGKGEVCGDLYKSCECSNGMGWYIRECVDCADTYKYACEVTDDNGVVGGVGFSCGGLYEDCQCSVVGQRWDDEQGKCRCLDNCAIGNILYSDGTCNSCLLDDKNVVGVIVKNEDGNGLVMSKDKITSYWSSDRSDVSGITNITSSATVQSDYNGKIYTDAIVDKYGVSASSNAGVYCYNYAPSGAENTQGQWYLPAGGEVYSYMYGNYLPIRNTLVNILGWNNLNYTFWISNERDSNYAWYIVWGNATISSVYKTGNSFYVVCMLPFEENDDGSAKICTSDYKYTCTNTNESLGSDICAGLYNKCVCAEGYYWSAEDGACLDCSGTDKFKYACSVDASTYITGGIGETCSGLYETCTCAEGYGFANGVCELCEDTFAYECVPDGTNNIKGGSGETCSGKYEACKCKTGYKWSAEEGACVVDLCIVGNILYSDGSCSATVDSSKTAIGVVAYDDGSLKRALALTSSSNKWSSNSVDVPNLTNYSSSSSAQGDKNGKENTRILVEYYGESSTTTAAVTCYNYTTAGTTKGDWYLGSAGEMYAVFVTNKTAVNNALSLLGKSTLASSDYWTSTEYNSSKANEIYNYNIYGSGETKTNSYKVQCMISF